MAFILPSKAEKNVTSCEDPIRVFQEFTGRNDLEFIEWTDARQPPGSNRRNFHTQDRNSFFTIDMDSCEIVTLNLPSTPAEGETAITYQEALETTQAFLAPRFDNFEKMTLIKGELQDHGTGGKEYLFLWAEQLGSQKAVGIQRVSVTVNAITGEIAGFTMIPAAPLQVDIEPAISREKALEIAIVDFKSNVVESKAELDVWWKDNDRLKGQILRWMITLESDEPISPEYPGTIKHALYFIDAQTGEILEVLH